MDPKERVEAIVKIGLVSGASPPMKCGIGDFAAALAGELKAEGQEVVVVTDKQASTTNIDYQIRAVIPHWRPSAVFQLVWELSNSNVDLVNIHYPSQEFGRFSAIDFLPLAWRLVTGRPLVSTIHEFLTFKHLGQLRVGQLVHSSSGVIVPEVNNLRAIEQRWPKITKRLVHIPLGPTLKPITLLSHELELARNRLDFHPDFLHLAFTGFISPGKGLEFILEAVDALPFESHVRLWLLSSKKAAHPRYEAYHQHIELKIKQLQHPDRIRWTGFLPADELSLHLELADLIVLPYDDGATLRRTTLLNALAHKRPVISTGKKSPIPGVHVVPPRDSIALREAIEILARDREARNQLAEEAMRSGLSLSWSSLTDQTIRYFQSLHDSPSNHLH